MTLGISTYSHLPFDVWKTIADFLAMPEVAIASGISRHVQHLIKNNGRLDFSSTNVVDKIIVRHLSLYKNQNQKIIFLNMTGCSPGFLALSKKCAAAISALPSLTELHLNEITTSALETLTHLPLKTLSLTAKEGGTLSVLSKFPSLKQLKLTSSTLSETNVDHLKKLSLEKFELIVQDSSNITDTILCSLSKIPLTRLHFNFCPLISDAGLFSISKLSLTGFSIIGNNLITHAGLQPICTPSLTNLGIVNCPSVDFTRLQALSEMPLIQLDLSTVHFDDACTARLKATLHKLTLVNVRVTDRSLEALSKFPHLKYLSLTRCEEITDDGVRLYINQPSLKKLYLNHCKKLTPKSIEHVSQLNPAFRCLGIQKENPKSEGMSFLSGVKHAFSSFF